MSSPRNAAQSAENSSQLGWEEGKLCGPGTHGLGLK